MTNSLAYISIYLGLFGWLFGSDKKNKQDQTSANQENSSIEEKVLEERPNIEEPQIQTPKLFPDGLPLQNATIPQEVGHPSAQNCGSCHTSIYSEWKNDGHGISQSYHTLREYIYQKEGLPFKESPLCQNCHLPVENQHQSLFTGFAEQDPLRPQYVENKQWSPLLYTEGVTCISCHARDEYIISIPRPSTESIKRSENLPDTEGYLSSPQPTNIDEEVVQSSSTDQIQTTDQSEESTTKQVAIPTENPIKINISTTSFTHTSSQNHSALPSTELSQSQLCATCHQSNESIGGIYNTFAEWQNSIYADQNVGCVSCHYDEIAVLDGSSSYSTLASHGTSKDLWEGLSLDFSIDKPIIQRGEKTPIKIALINTGSGHSIPTNPWRKYNFVVEIIDEKQKVIWKSSELVLGSDVKIIENTLIVEEKNDNLESTKEEDTTTDPTLENQTESKVSLSSESTDTPKSEEEEEEEAGTEGDIQSQSIIRPTHILSNDSGISILPFQRHIWSEEIEISVKKSSGIATLIISETTTDHVFIKSTLEIR